MPEAGASNMSERPTATASDQHHQDDDGQEHWDRHREVRLPRIRDHIGVGHGGDDRRPDTQEETGCDLGKATRCGATHREPDAGEGGGNRQHQCRDQDQLLHQQNHQGIVDPDAHRIAITRPYGSLAGSGIRRTAQSGSPNRRQTSWHDMGEAQQDRDGVGGTRRDPAVRWPGSEPGAPGRRPPAPSRHRRPPADPTRCRCGRA